MNKIMSQSEAQAMVEDILAYERVGVSKEKMVDEGAMVGSYAIPTPASFGFGSRGKVVGGAPDVEDRVLFTKELLKKLKHLKKDIKGLTGLRQGYKGTGRERGRVKVSISFAGGHGSYGYDGPNTELWIEKNSVDIGWKGETKIPTKGRSVDDVYQDIRKALQNHLIKTRKNEDRDIVEARKLAQAMVEDILAYERVGVSEENEETFQEISQEDENENENENELSEAETVPLTSIGKPQQKIVTVMEKYHYRATQALSGIHGFIVVFKATSGGIGGHKMYASMFKELVRNKAFRWMQVRGGTIDMGM